MIPLSESSVAWLPVALLGRLALLRLVRLSLGPASGPGGPQPVRTVQRRTGFPNPSARQQDEIASSSALHTRTRTFLALVATPGGLILMENPSSSLLWLEPAVQSWSRINAPFSGHVAACQYGLSLYLSGLIIPSSKPWPALSASERFSPLLCG